MNDFHNVKRKGVEVMIFETGEIFDSIQSCADYLNVNPTWLGRVVRNDKGYCTIHGYHIVRTDGKYNTVDLTKKEYRGRPGIQVRIAETGEEFDSITECAKAICGYPSKISDALYHNNRHTHRGYHFQLID